MLQLHINWSDKVLNVYPSTGAVFYTITAVDISLKLIHRIPSKLELFSKQILLQLGINRWWLNFDFAQLTARLVSCAWERKVSKLVHNQLMQFSKSDFINYYSFICVIMC